MSSRKVSYDTLVSELLFEITKNIKMTVTGDIPTRIHGPVDMYVYKHTNVYGLLGDFTLYFREHIPLCYNTSGRLAKPLYNKKYGYMYFRNDSNKVKLVYLCYCINNVNRKYSAYTAEDGHPPMNKKYGIIGWDVPYKEAKWVDTLFTSKTSGKEWNPKFNPKVILGHDNNELFKFQKSSFSVENVNNALRFLLSRSNEDFDCTGLHPKLLYYYRDTASYKKAIYSFIDSGDTSAVIAWSKHARTLYINREENKAFLIDPWKQELLPHKATDILLDILEERGTPLLFKKRKPEQMDEGSCAVISIIRALLTVINGDKGLTMKIPFDYAVLVSRVMSYVR